MVVNMDYTIGSYSRYRKRELPPATIIDPEKSSPRGLELFSRLITFVFTSVWFRVIYVLSLGEFAPLR
jgi:hypothetical protein